MDFDSIVNIRPEEKSTGYYNDFYINKEKPPYEIYIMVGDPDEWQGVTLQKK
ncbi:MAG: hypothetical protein LBR81_09905 [Prevotellaceae bacterium]|jgi:hypothetical protein|nr:hypothetical protein [Prevotellaceae bacterium]